MTERTQELEADTSRRGLVAGVAFLVVLAFFWPTVASFADTWALSWMTHGWLVAGLAIWLIWRDRGEILRGRGGDPLLLGVLAGLSLAWLAATVTYIQIGHQTLLVLLLVCWGLAVFGRKAARTVIVIGATFLLALPLWSSLTPVLRRATTLVSGGIVRLLGIEALIVGDVIHIQAGTFLVEDGCAGLNYLMAALVVGAFYATLLVKGWRTQLAVVGIAAAIAIVGNWIRVTALIVIGHVTQMQSGIIGSHVGFGWVIFSIGLVPFFLLARWMEKRSSANAKGQGAVPAPTVGEPGVEVRPLIWRAATATAFAVIGPALYFGISLLPPPADPQSPGLADLAQGDGWQMEEPSEPRSFDWHPAYQGANRHETARFTGRGEVYGDRFVYREQAHGAKLIGYPNRIAPVGAVLDQRVVGPVDPAGRRWIQQAIVDTPEGPVLTWYWYRVGGVETFSRLQAKVLEIPAFLRRNRTAELIAVSAACDPDGCRTAFQTLAGFMGARLRVPDPGEPEIPGELAPAGDPQGQEGVPGPGP